MNYNKYALSFRQHAGCICVCGLVTLVVAWLFYRAWYGMLLFVPLYYWLRKEYIAQKVVQQKDRLLKEFKDCMQAVSTSLLAGYSMENAWKAAEKELMDLYGVESAMYQELCQVNASVRMNQSLEEALLDFSSRSGCEEIESFAEVFSFAKRSGGDFAGIIQTTVWKLAGRMEVEAEIATILAGKKLEGRIMNVMPLLILAYMNLCAGDFLAPLYGSIGGSLLMTGALGVYAVAIKLSDSILAIEI